MSCLFSPGGITKVFYPRSHPTLPGLTFSASVSNQLSFLHLDFLSPAISSCPTTFPALVEPAESSLKLIRCFGIDASAILEWMPLELPY